MERSFGLQFFLKKSKYDKAGESVIYMRITVNGKAVEISTKRRSESLKWNPTAGRSESKTEVAKLLNTYLDVLQRKVYEKRKFLVENDHEVTADKIKTLMQGGELVEHKYMLREIFSHHNEQMAALVGNEYSPGTLERYITSFKHTMSFINWKYNKDDFDISQLNYEFITEYEFWLKSVRKCGHNSTIKYLANFRKIVNRCLHNGWLPKDPFLGFKMTKREVERTALTQFELDTLTAKQFPTPRLGIVRDIFLFSCYSGLAYADVKKLKRSEIVIGIDGEKWLVSKRQKTDIAARIPLLPAALQIIQKYSTHPHCIVNDRVLPVLSNQKMNAYLKEIAEKCEIDKPFTYHIARHTFATTITLSNGVPIETVSKMLGHRNLKTTQQYAKILDLKISEDMKALRGKFL